RPGIGTDEAFVDPDGWIRMAGERLMPARDVPLPGRHMLGNALAAGLGALMAGAPTERIAEGIASFRGVAHRLEQIRERGGVRWVNDSQATIPVAAIAALEAYDAPIILISGGQGKGLDYDELAEVVVGRARAVVLMGETADELASLIRDRVPVERASDMADAVAKAARRALPGNVVLLAPAAASFDMFTDYAARGDAFRSAVQALEEAG
ncbi:MAG: cyanophycin synthetase, partial [Candidatus Limnocylindria bacterium]